MSKVAFSSLSRASQLIRGVRRTLATLSVIEQDGGTIDRPCTANE